MSQNYEIKIMKFAVVANFSQTAFEKPREREICRTGWSQLVTPPGEGGQVNTGGKENRWGGAEGKLWRNIVETQHFFNIFCLS